MKHITAIYPKNASICNCMNMRRASRAVTQFYDETLKPSGLTINQLSLLRHIEIAQQITISNLANIIRVDRTTLNRNLKPLVDDGFVVVQPGKDSRTRQIMLTAAGKDAVVEGWKLWQEAQSSLCEYMGKENLETLTQLLSKLEAIVP